jgi:hypothetical protein
VASDELLVAAGKNGIKKRTLLRAKDALGVKAKKGDFKGGWVWHLPTDECQLGVARVPTTDALAPLGESESTSGSSARVSSKSATASGLGTLGIDAGTVSVECTPDEYRCASGRA